MITIRARNVNDAYRKGMRLIEEFGEAASSRNGPVLRAPDIVSTEYLRPGERVLLDPQRDANPFFHLFEALWMLDGRDDVLTLDHLLPSFSQFSDDGATFHGAYGARWRKWPVLLPGSPYHKEIDQLKIAIDMLTADPLTRRAVIAMWDPARDLGMRSKDLPCNDLINLGIRTDDDGVDVLDLSVMCRSNDIVLGCYGANAVHMSVLHEYLATMIGVAIGTYTQISFDYHMYVEQPYRRDKYWPFVDQPDDDLDYTDDDIDWQNPYERELDYDRDLRTWPLITDVGTFDRELHDLMNHVQTGTAQHLIASFFTNTFFTTIAIPMHLAFEQHKAGDDERAAAILNDVNEQLEHDNDWLIAGLDWIDRRVERRRQRTRAESGSTR